MPLTFLLTVLLPSLVALPTDVRAQAGPQPAAPYGADTCGSQRFATVALGDALGHVRAARVYADAPARRKALAELDVLLVEQIQAEPDSNFRHAAWGLADQKSRIERAVETRQRAETFSQRAPTAELEASALEQRLSQEYRGHLEEVVKLVDPRSPRRCASNRWRPIYTAAVQAEAL